MLPYIIHGSLSQVTWYVGVCLHESKPSSRPSIALPVWDDKQHPDAPLASAQQTLNSFAAPVVSIYFHDNAAAVASVGVVCVLSAVDDWRWFLSNASAQPCENLHTCSHDVCTHVICLLSLIPSRGNVVTPLASQTPLGSKCVFCKDMYCIYGHEGKIIMIYPPQVRSCMGLLHVLRSVSTSHSWVNVSTLSAETGWWAVGKGAALLLEVKAFFSQIKYIMVIEKKTTHTHTRHGGTQIIWQ